MILVSQVAGQGRWSQFNLPLAMVTSFFGDEPEIVNEVSLRTRHSNGSYSHPEVAHAMYKPASSNWAFEIPGANGLPFDDQNRPILAMADLSDGTYSYDLITSVEGRHADIQAHLLANRQTPGGHLARMIVSRGSCSALHLQI